MKKLICNKIYKFSNENNLIYRFQLGFRQQYSTFHALIKKIDKGNIGYCITFDLQKTFDTVKHEILLAKLEHYGICGVADNWFKSYLFDRRTSVSTNGHASNTTLVKCVVLQDSVLGTLLFLIYINDLNHAINFCNVLIFMVQTYFILVNW